MALMMTLDGGVVSRNAQQAAAQQTSQQQPAQGPTTHGTPVNSGSSSAAADRAARLQRELEALMNALREAQEQARQARQRQADSQAKLTQAQQNATDAQAKAKTAPSPAHAKAARTAQQDLKLAQANAIKDNDEVALKDQGVKLAQARVTQKKEQQQDPGGKASPKSDQDVKDAEAAYGQADTKSKAADDYAVKEQKAQQAEAHADSLEPPPGLPSHAYGKADWDKIRAARADATRLRSDADSAQLAYGRAARGEDPKTPLLPLLLTPVSGSGGGGSGGGQPTLLAFGNGGLPTQGPQGTLPGVQFPLKQVLEMPPFPLPGAQPGTADHKEALYAPPGSQHVGETVTAITQGKSVDQIAKDRNISSAQVIAEAKQAGVEISVAAPGDGDVVSTTMKQGDVEITYHHDYQNESLTVEGSYDDPAAPGGKVKIDAWQDGDGRIHHTEVDPATGEKVVLVTDYKAGTETRIAFDDQGRRVEITTKLGAPPVSYKVKPDDTVSDIAKAQGMSVAELLELNPQLKNPDLIHPNEDLVIARSPTTVEVFEKDGSSIETITGGDGKRQVVFVSPEGERVTLAGDKSGKEAQTENVRKQIFDEGKSVAQVALALHMTESQVLALLDPGTVDVTPVGSNGQTVTISDPSSGKVVIEHQRLGTTFREEIAGDKVFHVRQFNPKTGQYEIVEKTGATGHALQQVDDKQATVDGLTRQINDLNGEIRMWQKSGDDPSVLYAKRRELTQDLDRAKADVEIQQGKADKLSTATDKASVIDLARKLHAVQSATRPGSRANTEVTVLLGSSLALIDKLTDAGVAADKNVRFLEAGRDLEDMHVARQEADDELEAQYQKWKRESWLWNGLDEAQIKEREAQGARPMGGINRGYRNAEEADQAARKEFAQARDLWSEIDDREPPPEHLAWEKRNRMLEAESRAQTDYNAASKAKGQADIAVEQHDVDALLKEKDDWMRAHPDEYADTFPKQKELDDTQGDIGKLTIAGLLADDDTSFQNYLMTLPIGQRDTEERRKEAIEKYRQENRGAQESLDNQITYLQNRQRRNSIDLSTAFIEDWGKKHPEQWARYQALGQTTPTSSANAAEYRMGQREALLDTPEGKLLRPALEAQDKARVEERKIGDADIDRIQKDLDGINKGIDNHSWLRDAWGGMFGDTADDAKDYTEGQRKAAQDLKAQLDNGTITLKDYVAKHDALMGAYNHDSFDWANELRDSDETWGTIDMAVRTVLSAAAAVGVTILTGNPLAGAAAGMAVNEVYDLVGDIDAMANGQALSNDGHVSLLGLISGAIFTDDVTGAEARMAVKDKVIDGASNLVTGGGVAAGLKTSAAMTAKALAKKEAAGLASATTTAETLAKEGGIGLGRRVVISGTSGFVGQSVDGAGRVGVDTLQLAIEGKLDTPEGMERLRKSLANAGINALLSPIGGGVAGAIPLDSLSRVTGIALQAMNDGAMNMGIAEITALLLEGRHMNTGEMVSAGLGTLPGTMTNIAFHPDRMATRGYVGHLGADGEGRGPRQPSRDPVTMHGEEPTVVLPVRTGDGSAVARTAGDGSGAGTGTTTAGKPVAKLPEDAATARVTSGDDHVPRAMQEPADFTPVVMNAQTMRTAAGPEGSDAPRGVGGRSKAGRDASGRREPGDESATPNVARDEVATQRLAVNRGKGLFRRARGVDVNLIPTTPGFARLREAMERFKGVEGVSVIAGTGVTVRVRDTATGRESTQNWMLGDDGETPLAPHEAAARIQAADALPDDGSAVLILGCDLSTEYLGHISEALGRPVLSNTEMVHVYDTPRGSRIATGPEHGVGETPRGKTKTKSIEVREIPLPTRERGLPASLVSAKEVAVLAPDGAGIYRNPDDASVLFWNGKSAEPVPFDQAMGSQRLQSGTDVVAYALGDEWVVLVGKGAPGTLEASQSQHALADRVALHEQLHEVFEAHEPGFGDAHVVRMHGPVMLPDGRPALIARREPGSTRDTSYRQYVSERTGKDLAAIMQVLEDSGLQVNDLQFLLTAEGRVMVNDPRAIYPREEGARFVREQDHDILARAAKAHDRATREADPFATVRGSLVTAPEDMAGAMHAAARELHGADPRQRAVDQQALAAEETSIRQMLAALDGGEPVLPPVRTQQPARDNARPVHDPSEVSFEDVNFVTGEGMDYYLGGASNAPAPRRGSVAHEGSTARPGEPTTPETGPLRKPVRDALLDMHLQRRGVAERMKADAQGSSSTPRRSEGRSKNRDLLAAQLDQIGAFRALSDDATSGRPGQHGLAAPDPVELMRQSDLRSRELAVAAQQRLRLDMDAELDVARANLRPDDDIAVLEAHIGQADRMLNRLQSQRGKAYEPPPNEGHHGAGGRVVGQADPDADPGSAAAMHGIRYGGMHPLAEDINPLRDNNNCVVSSIALDFAMNSPGLQLSALPSQPRRYGQIEAIYGIRPTEYDGKADAFDAIEQLPDGSRGFIVIGDNTKPAHMMNFVREEGRTRVIDAQDGRYVEDFAETCIDLFVTHRGGTPKTDVHVLSGDRLALYLATPPDAGRAGGASYRIELGEPHALAAIVGEVNPQGSGTTCVNVAVTIDRMLSSPGTRMTAVPSDAKTLSEVRAIYGDPPVHRFGDSADTWDHLAYLPEGSRGFLVMGEGGDQISHMVNYVVQDGEVLLVDGMAGRIVTDFEAPVIHVIETQNGALAPVDHTVRSRDQLLLTQRLAGQSLPAHWPQEHTGANPSRPGFDASGAPQPPEGLQGIRSWEDAAQQGPRLVSNANHQATPRDQAIRAVVIADPATGSAERFVVSRFGPDETSYGNAPGVRTKRKDSHETFEEARAAAERLGGAWVHRVSPEASRGDPAKRGHADADEIMGSLHVDANGKAFGFAIPNMNFHGWHQALAAAAAPPAIATQAAATPKKQPAPAQQHSAQQGPSQPAPAAATQSAAAGLPPTHGQPHQQAQSTGIGPQTIDVDALIEDGVTFKAERPAYAGPASVADLRANPRAVATDADRNQTAYLTTAGSPDGHDALQRSFFDRFGSYVKANTRKVFGKEHSETDQLAFLGTPDFIGERFVLARTPDDVLAGGPNDAHRLLGPQHVYSSYAHARDAAIANGAAGGGDLVFVVRLIDTKRALAAVAEQGSFTNKQVDGIVGVRKTDGKVHEISISNPHAVHAPKPGEKFVNPHGGLTDAQKMYSPRQKAALYLKTGAYMAATGAAFYASVRLLGGATFHWSYLGVPVSSYLGTRNIILRYAFDAFLYRGGVAGIRQGAKIRLQKHVSPEHEDSFALLRSVADPKSKSRDAALFQLNEQLGGMSALRRGIGFGDRRDYRKAIDTIKSMPEDLSTLTPPQQKAFDDAMVVLDKGAFQRAVLPVVGKRGAYNRIPSTLRNAYQSQYEKLYADPSGKRDEVAAAILATAPYVRRGRQYGGAVRGGVVRNVPASDRARYVDAVKAVARNPQDFDALLTLEQLHLETVVRHTTGGRGAIRGLPNDMRHSIELEYKTWNAQLKGSVSGLQAKLASDLDQLKADFAVSSKAELDAMRAAGKPAGQVKARENALGRELDVLLMLKAADGYAAIRDAIPDLPANSVLAKLLDSTPGALTSANTPVGRSMLAMRIASFALSNSGGTRIPLDPFLDSSWTFKFDSIDEVRQAISKMGSVVFIEANNTGLAASIIKDISNRKKARQGLDITVKHDDADPANMARSTDVATRRANAEALKTDALARKAAAEAANDDAGIKAAEADLRKAEANARDAQYVPLGPDRKPVKTYRATDEQPYIVRFFKGLGNAEAATHKGLDAEGNPVPVPSRYQRLAQWSSWGDSVGALGLATSDALQGVLYLKAGHVDLAAIQFGKAATWSSSAARRRTTSTSSVRTGSSARSATTRD